MQGFGGDLGQQQQQRKLEEMIGEPGGMSTPVPSPDKARNNTGDSSEQVTDINILYN